MDRDNVNENSKVFDFVQGNNPSTTKIDWNSNVNTNSCAFCHVAYRVKNIRTQGTLCPECKSIEWIIDRVRNGKSYSLITPTERGRIMERVKTAGRKRF